MEFTKDWKACIRQKRIPSSNLGRSAKTSANYQQDSWCFSSPNRANGLYKIGFNAESCRRFLKLKPA